MYSVGIGERQELKTMKKIWILVHVWRGLIQEPEMFFDADSANDRRAEILKGFNPAYDEIEIFEKQIL